MNRSAILSTATALLSLVPGTSQACGMCTDSAAYSTVPWAYPAFFVLAFWALIDWWIRTLSAHPCGIDDRTVGRFIGGLAFICALGCVAGIMSLAAIIFLTTPFLLFRLIREIVRPRSLYRRMSRILSVTCVVAMLIIASVGTVRRAMMTELEVFERLVLPGTGPSHSYAASLARDPDLDLATLRRMISAEEKGRAEKAFEVLANRRNQQDLIALAPAILPHLPVTATPSSTDWNSENFRFRMWLESLELKHIATRQDLRDWLSEQAFETNTLMVNAQQESP